MTINISIDENKLSNIDNITTKETNPTEKRWVTSEEVAIILGVTAKQVRFLTESGEFYQTIKFNDGIKYHNKKDVELLKEYDEGMYRKFLATEY